MSTQDSKTNNTSENTSQSREDSIFTKLFSFILGRNDPEKNKRRELKYIAKNLKRQRSKFYKSRGDMAEAGLARFFYDLYKIFGPIQTLLRLADSSDALKTMVIEASITDADLAIKDQLTEEAIREQVEELDSKKVIENVKNNLKKFQSVFIGVVVDEINSTYILLDILIQLIGFDYYFLLKKFDARLPENDFVYKPHFIDINGTYLVEDLKNFLDIIAPFDSAAPWSQVFEMYKQYRGSDLITVEQWRRIVQLIQNVKRSRALEMVTQLISEDPTYKPVEKITKENIVERYLSKQKTQVETSLQKIASEKKNQKIEQLKRRIFGTDQVSSLQNYTETANLAVLKKSVGRFIHVTPLNYLKTYLIDYLKTEIRTIVDLLLVKGKWSTNQISQQFSESYHQLLNAATEIIEFDEALAEEGEIGKKIRGLNLRAKRDKNANTQLWQLVKQINDRAKNFIVEAAKNLIILGKMLKLALDDHDKTNHDIIINWQEIESATDQDIRELMLSVYKQIYYFMELLKQFQ